MVFEDLEPLIGFFFLPCWPYVFGLILRKSNSSSNGWFIPSFHFVGKKKGILNTLGRIARSYELYIRRDVEFFTIPTVFALEDSI